MKPLFTVHGGEYLVGSHIEGRFRHVNVWIPSRDTGVDLLVSDQKSQRTVSLQVKFSKDFLVTHMKPEFQKSLRACGWWTINRHKLQASPACPALHVQSQPHVRVAAAVVTRIDIQVVEAKCISTFPRCSVK